MLCQVLYFMLYIISGFLFLFFIKSIFTSTKLVFFVEYCRKLLYMNKRLSLILAMGVFHCEKCIKNILKFLHVYAHFRDRRCYYNTRNPPQYIISFVAFSVTRIPSPKRAAIVAALIFAFMKN